MENAARRRGILTKHSSVYSIEGLFPARAFSPWKFAPWREFYQVFTFSIARRGLRNGNLLTAVNPRTSWRKIFQRDANSSPLSRIKICPVLLTLENGNGEYYIKKKKLGGNFLSNKIWFQFLMEEWTMKWIDRWSIQFISNMFLINCKRKFNLIVFLKIHWKR